MDVSDIIANIIDTTNKITNYKALLMTTKGMYEHIQVKIFQMSMEISSGMYDINSGSHVHEGVSNLYIKTSILDGLKKRALVLIEDEVILEFMIAEREEKVASLKEQLASMQNAMNSQ